MLFQIPIANINALYSVPIINIESLNFWRDWGPDSMLEDRTVQKQLNSGSFGITRGRVENVVSTNFKWKQYFKITVAVIEKTPSIIFFFFLCSFKIRNVIQKPWKLKNFRHAISSYKAAPLLVGFGKVRKNTVALDERKLALGWQIKQGKPMT